MDLRQVFAANLSGIRNAKGLSQEALAHEAGVNRAYLTKIEGGGTWVGLEIIDKLASALEVEPA
jgi:transcriptional regulator with XRE-family HTH domain